jgi:long-subunit fatty acid transport protein
MKKSFIIILTVLLTVLFIGPAHSQMKKLGQAGLPFLKIDVSAREAAMAGAYTLAGDDATAMFSNPAGLAMAKTNADVFVGRINWFADISYNALAAMYSFEEWGTFGVSFMNADYGQIIGTRVADTEKGYVETGDVGVNAYVVGFSYARALTNKFTVGAQVKYTYQHLGGNTFPDGSWVKNEVDGFAFDFGTIFYPGWQSFGFPVIISIRKKIFHYRLLSKSV